MMVVDGLIVVLLLAALGLGLRLQRSLRQLRQGDGEIARLIADLDAATGRSAGALDGLRQTAEATGARLSEQLASTQRLLDDLRFLGSRGEQLADRLEQQISRGRPLAQRAATAPAVRPATVTMPHDADRTAELERTLRALR
jgi:hypothetical protein